MAPIDPNWPSPYIENISDGEEVYSRLLLLTGRAGPANATFDGNIIVEVHSENSSAPPFAPQAWPVTDSYFKALAPLQPGRNTIRFHFEAPANFGSRSSNDNGTTVNVHYTPLSQNPPLHLVILTASDSPLTVDCPPERRQDHAHVQSVVAKLQLWAYMCQAFTAEQMRRNGLGRRTFALDEQDGQPDSLEAFPAVHQRRAPFVHVVKSSHSTREFRDPDNAQQYKPAKRAQAMHEFASEALRSPSAPAPFHSPQGAYVAVLILDAHWDPQKHLLLGHAALGAGGPMGPGCKIGVFGSHSCWSWPRSIKEIVPAFMDCSDVDERYVVNDLGNIGTAWETLNVGHGAFIHEVGHALNLPHHKTGIMARGYHEWNRAFMSCEGKSKRCNSNGCRPFTSSMDDKENHWNRMSLISLRYHPTMRLPNDPYIPYQYTQMAPAFLTMKDGVSVHAPVGLGSIELEVDGRYVNHVEFPFYGSSPNPPPQNYELTTEHIGHLINADPRHCKVTIHAIGTDQRSAQIQDYSQLLKGSRLVIQTSPEGPAQPIPTSSSSGSKFKRGLDKFAQKHLGQNLSQAGPTPTISHTGPAGPGQMEVIKGIPVGQEKPQNPSFLIVLNSHQGSRPKLVKVDIHAGFALDGFKLYWSDGSKQTIGPCGGGSARSFKIEPPSRILRVKVRSGAWMDAISVVHERGETGLCGGGGGELRMLEPPPGSEVCGLFGTTGAWMDSLGIVYTA